MTTQTPFILVRVSNNKCLVAFKYILEAIYIDRFKHIYTKLDYATLACVAGKGKQQQQQ